MPLATALQSIHQEALETPYMLGPCVRVHLTHSLEPRRPPKDHTKPTDPGQQHQEKFEMR